MTSTLSPDPTIDASTREAPTADGPAAALNEPAPAGKPVIPTFTFPFAPATFAPGKGDNQPWHQKGNKSAHEKKIGAAPPGTRRSMGKR